MTGRLIGSARRAAHVVRTTTTAATIVVMVLVAGPAPVGGHLGIALVNGSSMQPTYHTGDLVVAWNADSYSPGDIVLFDSPQGRVIHRVTDVTASGQLTTRGDNRSNVDPWDTTNAHVIGRAVFHQPGVGAAITALQDTLGATGLAAFAFLSLAFAARPARRAYRRAVDPTAAHAAVAALATLVTCGALYMLAARGVAPAAVARPAVATASAACVALVAATAAAFHAHVRLRTALVDLQLGRRVVDVDVVDVQLPAVQCDATQLRRAADHARVPVLRTRAGSYQVVTDGVVLTYDSAAAAAAAATKPAEQVASSARNATR